MREKRIEKERSMMAVTAVNTDYKIKPKILVVEDDAALREALNDTLTLNGYSVELAKHAEQAIEILEQQKDINMVVSDINMGTLSGHDLLQHITRYYSHIPTLLMTAYGSIKDSVDAMRKGALDYLVKPFEPHELLTIVNRQTGFNPHNEKDELIAESPHSKQLFALAKRLAGTDSTALILGESGTGKEVLARFIHQHSVRADQPFIAINCAAIPENMLEAMLFGHEKGAYTGAYTSAPGKFEQANGGTLLLDEISEMDLGLQAKLLRVLQEKEVERIGGRKTIALDVRVIATSNRNMAQFVAEGKFREDLYYRLNILPLTWRPLRERVEDILPLAEQLLTKHASRQKRHGVSLDESAKGTLLSHGWPGNVRELDNVIQRSLILQPSSVISASDLGLEFSEPLSEPLSASPIHNMLQRNVDDKTVDQEGLQEELPKLLGDDLQRREFEIIAQTLKEEQGSRKNTAERLGISPRTLRYKLAKMRELGLMDGKKICLEGR